jgi:hypothetical protein
MASNPHLKEELQPIINATEIAIQSYFSEKTENAENKVVSALKEDRSSFFAYVNSKRKEKSRIGPLKEVRNEVPHYIYDPKRMADMLSKQYKSVFSEPLPDKKVHDPKTFFHTNLPNQLKHLTDILFNPDDMEEALVKLKSISVEWS